MISLDALPDDPAALRDMILAQQQKIVGMEAANRDYEALIQALEVTIARLKRRGSTERARRRSSARSRSWIWPSKVWR